MCQRSAIYCWSNIQTPFAHTLYNVVYTVNVIFTQLERSRPPLCSLWRVAFANYFYYMGRGIQPNLQRQWVGLGYDVTGRAGSDRMSASVSELTSDAPYINKK